MEVRRTHSRECCGGRGPVWPCALCRSAAAVRQVFMVGDGATDMEAKQPGLAADYVIGYAGVVARPSVLRRADFVVHSFDELTATLAP